MTSPLAESAVLEPQARAVDIPALVVGGILGEGDEPVRRVLDRRVEDLARGHVRVGGGDPPLASFEAELEIGVLADDPHLLRAVEALRDLLHLALERVPVDQDGAIEEVLELLERHARVLGERRGRVLTADPGLLHAEEGLGVRPGGSRDQREALLGDV